MKNGNAIIPSIAIYVLFTAGSLKATATVEFAKDVVPILQRRCFSCHNDRDSKGGFSLETAESVFDSGYIEPRDAQSSHILAVISPQDGKVLMPKDGEPLTETEIAVIAEWIDDGAVWPKGFRLTDAKVSSFDWWSYQPVRRPEVPELSESWGRTPIDAFVMRRLNENHLVPSPEADRRTLIRRVTYDLTGLPPTPEEVDSFIGDDSPDAYGKLIDRLLASPRYGERWARHWLDVVKYADTCGYDKDKLRPNAWPYRDYVIRSFNEDKPYARFVQEQVAGDVLFPGEPDGVLGLGFVAAGPWDFIGHVEVPETKIDGMVARNLDRDDMVSNVLNTFCSVTVQCARCHNHKFDPITQEHYYGLQAIFAAVDKADRPYDLDPKNEELRRQLAAKLIELHAEEAAAADEFATLGGSRLAKLDAEIDDLSRTQKVQKSAAFGYHSAISSQADDTKWVEVDLGKAVDVSQIIVNPCHDDFGDIGAGFGFPIRFRIEVTAGSEWETVADQAAEDFSNPGINAFVVSSLNHKIQRIRVTATRLAERRNDFILALAELQVLAVDGRNVAAGAAVSSRDSIEAPVRWGRSNLTDGQWPRALDLQAANQLRQSVAERDAIVRPILTAERVARDKRIQEDISATQKKLSELPAGRMVYAATTSFKPQGNFKPTDGKPRDVNVLYRGNIQQPTEPATPGFLPLGNSTVWRPTGMETERHRRAALAEWLTSRQHPLVWRSIVNRVWQYHFGRGIVSTPNDFGRMGAVPTHPDLLDWLTVEFRDNGQSIKELHRLIVTSSVYRQSSASHVGNFSIDGSNQYLWRMNRRRLEAEEIRDSILSVSGALNYEMGGPGFYLFKLEKPEHSPHYEYHKFDPRLAVSHRRSIYRFIVRSQPDPWMTTLDCADSSQSTPRRNETLTSLQALTLMNNQFNLVMAERFARRLQKETAGLPQQVKRALRLVVQRQITAPEAQELQAYARIHGLENLCRVLFNLSEFVFLD